MEQRERSWFSAIVFFLVAASVGLLGGCTEIGIIGSPMQSAADQGSLVLANPVPSSECFVDGTISAGKGLGYDVSGVDRKTNTVSFGQMSSLALSVFVGKNSETKVQVVLRDDNKTIDVTVTMRGNFGEAEQSKAVKIINDFKIALKRQFSV